MTKSILKRVFDSGFYKTRKYVYVADLYYGGGAAGEFCRVSRRLVSDPSSPDLFFCIAKMRFGSDPYCEYVLFNKKEVNPDGAQIQGSSCS